MQVFRSMPLGTSNKAKKMHKLTNSQLRLLQVQLLFEGGDVCMHFENVFVLQLHTEVV